MARSFSTPDRDPALSAGRDFVGGEFVLTEQRPRMQSRAEVVSLGQGDGVNFAMRERPVPGNARALPRGGCAMGVAASRAASASPLESSSTTRREPPPFP